MQSDRRVDYLQIAKDEEMKLNSLKTDKINWKERKRRSSILLAQRPPVFHILLEDFEQIKKGGGSRR